MQLGESVVVAGKWWMEKCGIEVVGARQFSSEISIHPGLFGIFRLFSSCSTGSTKY